MNRAKIQLSAGHNDFKGEGGAAIRQNDTGEWTVSASEMELVKNAGWILTKNTLLRKITGLFAELSGLMQAEWQKGNWPPELSQSTPKISKGENYKGLPYLVLDYPRRFSRTDIFAIRTLFWWGNYFSVTLHLKGRYKDIFLPVIREHISRLAENHYYICVSPDEWLHELDESNYRPLAEMTVEQTDEILSAKSFLKLTAKYELDKWNEAAVLLMQSFRTIVQVMSSE
jgi:hypothetical protein